ncbi:hypothetical protein [Pedobacter agri]|uniref:hypothetical protein n=1 Tax=Pedobacter agri TaxID=454586 RepID=UPI002930C773|nr:hypothetical protein [Pedobacter agri]
MTTDRKLKITFGILSVGLLTNLLFKLTNIPGGMILSGLFLGGMMIVGIIIGCLILTAILKLVFKRTSFLTILFITTTISFLAFHYQLYSPTLTIKVPNGYKGEINLVLSNVKDNILTVDSNGIGYINEWTFNKTYSRPIVEQLDGKNLDKNLVGFNHSTFFGTSIGGGNSIKTLSFEIVPDSALGQKQYYSKDFTKYVNKKLILLKEPNKELKVMKQQLKLKPNNNCW